VNAEPSYRRIVRLVEEKILSGEYPPGHRLPPERELCEIYGVSRITTRQALGELAQRALVIRHQGQGTFVSRPKVDSSLLGFFSISEALKADGRLVSTRVIRAAITTPDGPEAGALGCGPREKVLRVVRLRLVDGDPYALETSTLIAARFPGLERYDFGDRSLYDVLARQYGTQLVRARETLAPVMLTQAEAELLHVEIDQPALRLVRTTFDGQNTATEASGAHNRGDRCQLRFELWADQRAGLMAGCAGHQCRSATACGGPELASTCRLTSPSSSCWVGAV
jgi:GntR family transcriptional regulator